MLDRHDRTINYLRLSITDRCNLRCRYCMPHAAPHQHGFSEMLDYEQLLQIARAAISLGIRKVRVTGGEPLVRKGVIGFLYRLCALPGLDEVTLTTNGMLLEQFAEPLVAAGIRRINLSLDSLDAKTYAAITDNGKLTQVESGIAAAERAGLQLKLNMVVMRGCNDHEIEKFAALSLKKPWSIRFIEYMPTNLDPDWQQRSVSGAEILERLDQLFDLEELPCGPQCGPARPYKIRGARGTIGVITPMSDQFCSSCNRVRVTANGYARSCLLSEQSLDLRPVLRTGDEGALRDALRQVVAAKGDQHRLGDALHRPQPFAMNSIGG